MNISPDSPISLDEAAEICLRGLVKASTLRAAADRGELAIERLGRRLVTTPADVEAWRKLCRDRQKERACGSGPHQSASQAHGSSETDDFGRAQAAAQMRVEKLKNSLKNTSPQSTTQPKAVVVSLTSRSQT